MKEEPENVPPDEYPDRWWYRVYVLVMAFTVVVIAALWAFSRYFSS